MRRSTVHTRSDSPLVQRPERPAGHPIEAPNHLHSQSAQQRILQEHVTRVASGEGSSARAVDLHQLQIRPPYYSTAARRAYLVVPEIGVLKWFLKMRSNDSVNLKINGRF